MLLTDQKTLSAITYAGSQAKSVSSLSTSISESNKVKGKVQNGLIAGRSIKEISSMNGFSSELVYAQLKELLDEGSNLSYNMETKEWRYLDN